jgi:Tfp pilus assembly protein PilO
MSALTAIRPKVSAGSALLRARALLNPLNLHWAGVGLLAMVILYLLAQMGFLWHSANNHNADAIAQQRIALKTAEIAAQPLRGLDAKLARATEEADKFSRQSLPASTSEVAGELGALTKKQSVRLTRAQYLYAPVLVGSADELTEVRIDATLSGDYRPLVEFINSLERDKMFFVILGETLTGQQSGTVNLRLRLTTYERAAATEETPAEAVSPLGGNASTASIASASGGAQ